MNAVTIPMTSGGPFSFLAEVQFQPFNGMVGDTWQVNLVNDPDLTYFNDAGGTALGYSANVGQVMIGAVPEPSSMTLAALSSLGRSCLLRRRRSQG